MILLLVVFPIIFVITLLCVGLGLAYFETRRKARVRKLLWTAERATPESTGELVRNPENRGFLAGWVAQLSPVLLIERLLWQALSTWTSSHFLFLSAVCGLGGALLGWKLNLFSSPPLSCFLVLSLGSLLPLLLILRKRAKTFKAFEDQFPDALDFLARSMRAGHGFSISMEILAKDAADPLGAAFQRVCHELQLGTPIKEAFGNMLIQVPLIDVRFFVSSVLVQQETGGNLGEILESLAGLVRERFRVRGQVKALSAHGRITGMVLLFLPVAVVLILMVMSPEYLGTLTKDPDGRKLLYAAAAGQGIAYLCIKKIVNIKV